MPQLFITDAMLARLTAFKEIIETVGEREISFEDCTNLILEQGINNMLIQLLGTEDSNTLLNSILQLGEQYPNQIYHYISDRLRQGKSTTTLEEFRKRIGFL